MNSTDTGKQAEQLVAENLRKSGHKVLQLNWRTKFCEIDIVSTLNNTVYFTEVKFRNSAHWGDGLEYITPKKLKQMKFAAEMWLHSNNWDGEATIQGASVDNLGSINIVEIV